MKVLIITLFSLLLSSCSTAKKESTQNNSEFYSLAKRAKTEMTNSDYKNWLSKMLISKQSQYKGYESFQSTESVKRQQHEVMSSGATEVGGHQDVHQFKALSSGIRIKRWEEEKELLEKQLFYIKSQLSAIEE